MSQKPFAFPPPPPPPPRRADGYHQSSYQSQHGHGSGRGSYNSNFSNRASRGRGSSLGSDRNQLSNGFRGRGGAQYGRESAAGSSSHHSGFGQHSCARGANQTSLGGPPSPKRTHAQAFPGSFQPRHKPQAAPAVPSFNATIPGLIPALLPAASPRSPERRKKPRTQNQLGLTPAKEEHESSDDEEDEESKLAKSAITASIAFEHRGQTLRLQTAAEIAAWIAERRTRYPTAAKAEAAKKEANDRKRRWDEEKKLRQEEARQRREEIEESEKQQRELRKKPEEAQRETKSARAHPSLSQDENGSSKAEKARLKTEKLQRKAEKLNQQLVKAREALKRAQARATPGEVDRVDDRDSAISMADQFGLEKDKQEGHTGEGPALDISSHPSELEESDDETSSSGSSASEEEPVSDSDAVPEETTSRRSAPERVLPPSRKAATSSPASTLCRVFLRSGTCKYGKKCRYSHELPPGMRKAIPHHNVRPRRKTLYEAMVEKEQEAERALVLRAIIALGERGILDEPASNATENGLAGHG